MEENSEKNTADGIQDRTMGTACKILRSSLDLEQGGEGFHTTDPYLTVHRGPLQDIHWEKW